MGAEPIYVHYDHPVVDVGPAEYEGPKPQGVIAAPRDVEPVPEIADLHPVVDGGPAEFEASNPPGVVNADPPDPEPAPAHHHAHPLVDPGPAES